MKKDKNIIIEDFGNEWEKFDQINLINEELDEIFNDYFDIFPWEKIGQKSIGIDFGCGTGRWAKIVAPKRKAITKIIKTNNRKANFATILFDCKNSLVPSRYLFDAKSFKVLLSETLPNGLLISIYYNREI